MKCHIPQISWHNRDPVLSIDCQATNSTEKRIATAGTDTHIFIWLLNLSEKRPFEVEFVADLNRHTRAVNVVRFSPNGEILASGDDEACIILWKLQARDEKDLFDDSDDGNKEHWVQLKILRGHIDDISDLCWSKDSLALISGSVDNTALLWDIQKGKNVGIMSDHKGFVQGVAWDPVGQFYATLSSDRTLRIFSQQTKKILHKVQKAVIPGAKETSEGTPKASRIFYDDTLKTFCRRLAFSPDGELLIAPSGIIEQEDGKLMNASFVFSRHALNKPILCLPTNDKYTVAVRCCPVLFTLKTNLNESKEETGIIDPIFSLPYRIVFAVATQNAILLYDSQHTLPVAHISNIHYTRLTDLAWSSDGKILMASSTDGYCSFVIFAEEELGIPYKESISLQKESNSLGSGVHESNATDNNMDKNTAEKTILTSSSTEIDSYNRKEGDKLKESPDILLTTQLNPLESVSSEKNIESMETTVLVPDNLPSIDELMQASTISEAASNASTPIISQNEPNVDLIGPKNSKPGRRVQLITLGGR